MAQASEPQGQAPAPQPQASSPAASAPSLALPCAGTRCMVTKKADPKAGLQIHGADNGVRTRDPHLGKVVLYQLSHVRVRVNSIGKPPLPRKPQFSLFLFQIVSEA